jgi:alpha-tubulin suppressor-like RCC1 family protein
MISRGRSALVHAMLLGLLIASACGGGAGAVGGPAASDPARSSPGASGGDDNGAADNTPPPGPPKDVDCGDFTTCATATDGLVRCWGRDKEGELGDGKGKGERVKRGVVPGLGKVKKIALASRFGCAILDDKRVKCWGTGRIANDGKSFSDAKPTLVSGVEEVEELVASGAIACARSASGIVCWGADTKTIGTPPKGSFKQIAAGFTHACALDTGGSVSCWGPSDWGGSGMFAKPAGITGAVQVVTGDRHGCVLTKGQTVQCWGMNDAGQLGIKSDMDPHKKAVAVPGITGAVRLIAGEASTCALLGDGAVRCWGSNGEGELGLGTRSSDERPALVTALSDVEQICLASAHGCALTKQRKLLCWGSNAFGQLGDGTKERRPAPTPVAW